MDPSSGRQCSNSQNEIENAGNEGGAPDEAGCEPSPEDLKHPKTSTSGMTTRDPKRLDVNLLGKPDDTGQCRKDNEIPNGFLCKCKRCEYCDNCIPNPCQHGGVCIEGPHKHICQCRLGFEDTKDHDNERSLTSGKKERTEKKQGTVKDERTEQKEKKALPPPIEISVNGDHTSSVFHSSPLNKFLRKEIVDHILTWINTINNGISQGQDLKVSQEHGLIEEVTREEAVNRLGVVFGFNQDNIEVYFNRNYTLIKFLLPAKTVLVDNQRLIIDALKFEFLLSYDHHQLWLVISIPFSGITLEVSCKFIYNQGTVFATILNYFLYDERGLSVTRKKKNSMEMLAILFQCSDLIDGHRNTLRTMIRQFHISDNLDKDSKKMERYRRNPQQNIQEVENERGFGDYVIEFAERWPNIKDLFSEHASSISDQTPNESKKPNKKRKSLWQANLQNDKTRSQHGSTSHKQELAPLNEMQPLTGLFDEPKDIFDQTLTRHCGLMVPSELYSFSQNQTASMPDETAIHVQEDAVQIHFDCLENGKLTEVPCIPSAAQLTSINGQENMKSFNGQETGFTGEQCQSHSSLAKVFYSKNDPGEVQETLRLNCRNAGLEILCDTPGNGNCFFEAVFSQLKRLDLKDGRSPKELRSELVEYLRRKRTFLGPDGIINLEEFVDKFEEYCTKMSQEGFYADHVAVLGMAHMLQRNIFIVTSAPGSRPEETFITVVGKDDFSGDPLLLGHVWENHYESLSPIDSTASSSQLAPNAPLYRFYEGCGSELLKSSETVTCPAAECNKSDLQGSDEISTEKNILKCAPLLYDYKVVSQKASRIDEDLQKLMVEMEDLKKQMKKIQKLAEDYCFKEDQLNKIYKGKERLNEEEK